MNHLRAVSLAVFAASVLVSISVYHLVNDPGYRTGMAGGEQRVSMFVQPLDLEPLFPRPEQETNEE